MLVGRLCELQLVDTEANKYRYATQRFGLHALVYRIVRAIRGGIFLPPTVARLARRERLVIYSSTRVRPAGLPEPDSGRQVSGLRCSRSSQQLLGISTDTHNLAGEHARPGSSPASTI